MGAGLCACDGSQSAVTPDAAATAGDTGRAADSPPSRPVLMLSPTSKDFGEVPAGDTSAPATFTISNAGGGPITDLYVEVTGFNIPDGGNRCGPTLEAAASCTFDVICTPLHTRVGGSGTADGGSQRGMIRVLGGDQTVTATLEATRALPEVLEIFPGVWVTFVPLGVQSAPVTFTLTNTRRVPSSPLTTVVEGPASRDFIIVHDGCTDGVADRASCTVTVALKPSSRDISDRRVHLVVSGAAGEQATALMFGKATSGDVSIVPVTANFGTIAVGATADQTFTVTNNAATAIEEPHTYVEVFDSKGAWSVLSTTCTGPLPPGGSCTATVRFAPTTAGDTATQLSVGGVRAETGSDYGVAVLSGTGR
jgi:hypothetical protein